jgi:hypothetical protein
MSSEPIDVVEIVDGVVKAVLASQTPAVPSVIATAIAHLVFAEAGARYSEYRAQILACVCERMKLFSGVNKNG